MKKFNPPLYFLLIPLILLVIGNTNCKKSARNDGALLGKWISTDLVDTIEFSSEKSLCKMFSGVKDYFDYSLSGDSITIRYNGKNYILVSPTTHFYQIKNNELTIDFRPSCYGFRGQETKFIRK
jgi:hypothetical protein